MSELGLELSQATAADGSVMVRLLVVNHGYEPVKVDRRRLWGPHPESSDPPLLSSEPSTEESGNEIVVLNPDGIFGRERRYAFEPGQTITFHGYLLRRETDRLLPTGPGDADDLAAAAEPLSVTFG